MSKVVPGRSLSPYPPYLVSEINPIRNQCWKHLSKVQPWVPFLAKISLWAQIIAQSHWNGEQKNCLLVNTLSHALTNHLSDLSIGDGVKSWMCSRMILAEIIRKFINQSWCDEAHSMAQAGIIRQFNSPYIA